jgi:hypothetical protein
MADPNSRNYSTIVSKQQTLTSQRYISEGDFRKLSFFVQPRISDNDPAGGSLDLGETVSISKNALDFVEEFCESRYGEAHLMIFAETGVGKSTFLLALLEKGGIPKKSCVYIALADPSWSKAIQSVAVPNDCVLLLDGLDEQNSLTGSDDDQEQFWTTLINVCKGFYRVIVTCRAQFFRNDALIPDEFGQSDVSKRPNRLRRAYLQPFDEREKTEWLAKRFQNASKHAKAKSLVDNLGPLASRPMILEFLQELISTTAELNNIASIYEFLISKWLARESKYAEPSQLLNISKTLAVAFFTSDSKITAVEFANAIGSYEHNSYTQMDLYKRRSLIVRDSSGLMRFAHRTFLDYLFVVKYIDGDQTCLTRKWNREMVVFFWAIYDSNETAFSNRLFDDHETTQLLSSSLVGSIDSSSNKDLWSLNNYLSTFQLAQIRGALAKQNYRIIVLDNNLYFVSHKDACILIVFDVRESSDGSIIANDFSEFRFHHEYKQWSSKWWSKTFFANRFCSISASKMERFFLGELLTRVLRRSRLNFWILSDSRLHHLPFVSSQTLYSSAESQGSLPNSVETPAWDHLIGDLPPLNVGSIIYEYDQGEDFELACTLLDSLGQNYSLKSLQIDSSSVKAEG